ncbi:MAG: histidinol-phosphate aminotransferase family protein [Acidilobaceae archaeon]|nr:histidinol-phosphate aminotransferase family protein [Acidilobaceae archaeon]MCX8165842.1 histidinol-phosphate aminotransferase family protein [Acidilobaceae archaeon]MDW7974850.1 histidinol-phosphate transaminase [Sulfolobales archaeon]
MRAHGGRAPEGVIDFSAPLNPLGPPEGLAEIVEELARSRSYTRYPDYEYRELREALASYYGLDEEEVVPLNGAAEALNLLVELLRPRAVITFEPTFGDHKAYLRALRIPWITLPLGRRRFALEAELLCSLPAEVRRGSLVLLSNPNNPTGHLARREELEKALECSSYLLVDEAFADFTLDAESMLGRGAFVARSLTKILAIPGLRAGFLYAPREARKVDAIRQPWNVNSLAAAALARFLREGDMRGFVRRSAEVLGREGEFLLSALSSLGLRAFPSAAPFLLAEHAVPHPLFNSLLAKRGVYVRDASSFHYLTPYHSRISVRLREENVRLVEAIRGAVAEGP